MSQPTSCPERMALNADEFATRWGTTPDDIHDLRKAGKLPYRRKGLDGITFPIAVCDRAMMRTVITAKTDPIYQRNKHSGKRVGKTAKTRAAK